MDEHLEELQSKALDALQEFLRLALVTLRVLVLLVVLALPWSWRAMTVGANVAALVWAYPLLYRGLGGYAAGVLPAVAVCLLPTVAALAVAAEVGVEPWGAFLVGAGLTVLAGWAARHASTVHLSIVLAAIQSGIVLYFAFGSEEEKGGKFT